MSTRRRGANDREIDGDTLFFFNYRSDRMREIVSVFGLPDKPMEVDVPKDLVCSALIKGHKYTD